MFDRDKLLQKLQDEFNRILDEEFDEIVIKKLQRTLDNRISDFIRSFVVQAIDKELSSTIKEKIMGRRDDIIPKLNKTIEEILDREIKNLPEKLKQNWRRF